MSRLDALQVAGELAHHSMGCAIHGCPCAQLQVGDVVCVYDTSIYSTFPIPEGQVKVVGVAKGKCKHDSWASEVMVEGSDGMFEVCEVDLISVS